ncbi:beta-galactosidase [Flavobacterium akiainvivens]|uniref:Beta-galactosidase n=1 Tax=Flavobacterium akiainvivens TaxID=1202724 RepID=A0A0M8MHD7_9FLAO|nr:beta-galactosidase [Flavobacterium akiainvivens]KOS05638.1 beta-galactosidase [Flavobacterium akiainvivens]SFQ35844.1 beta-galactosidase [Flavobacterium akiainvivens]
MKKLLNISLLVFVFANCVAQKATDFFPEKELTTVGAYYYPEHWDETQWDRDFKKMADMGFEFTHFAEFAWTQLEPEEGKYDFAWLDRAVALAAKYKLKVIMCTSTATPPVWLTRKHPEILKMREDGTYMDHGSRQHASFSNEFYRSYSMKMITEQAKHYGNDSRIIGWQLDNEPASNVDYGPDAQKRFRLWLKDKYKTIDALNKSWGTNFWSNTYTTFDQINIPQHSQWGMNLYQRLDHSRFCDNETATFLDEQAKTIAKIASKQWITSNYIPNYDARYIGNSKALDFVTYTRYMVYGEHNGTGLKGYRTGEYSRIAMANDYFRPLSPLYGVMELQPGQVNWGSINSQPLPGAVRLWLWHVFAGGSKLTCTYRFRAPIYGYEQYHAGILGTDGVTPTRGGLEFEEFIKEIKVLRKNYAKGTVPAEYQKRKTAILYDPDNTVAINQNKQTNLWDTEAHVLKYYKTLKGFGAPVDFIRDSMDFAQYPVIVVPAYQQMSRQLIKKFTDYASNGGNLVLSTRSGHQDEQGHLWQAKHAEPIYPLIGAEIEFYDLLKPHAPDNVSMDGKQYTWTSWGDVLKPTGSTKTWATYQGDFYAGKPAVTFRTLGKGTVTYVGPDSNTGDLEQAVLTKLYNQLNIPVENYPPGVIVEYRDGFGIAMNYADTPYEVKIPAGAEVLIGKPTLPAAGVVVWKIKK